MGQLEVGGRRQRRGQRGKKRAGVTGDSTGKEER